MVIANTEEEVIRKQCMVEGLEMKGLWWVNLSKAKQTVGRKDNCRKMAMCGCGKDVSSDLIHCTNCQR